MAGWVAGWLADWLDQGGNKANTQPEFELRFFEADFGKMGKIMKCTCKILLLFPRLKTNIFGLARKPYFVLH